jgi:uncharacterized membrane protein YjjB (DUF3815 family)
MLLLEVTAITFLVIFRWPKALIGCLLNLAAIGMFVSGLMLASKGMHVQATQHALAAILLGAMGYAATWVRKLVHGR